MTAAQNLHYLLPELIVGATGIAVIVADLFRGDDDGHTGSRPWLAYLGIAGLVAALVATIALSGTRAVLFDELILLDPLAVFFKVLFLAIAIAILLLSVDSLPRFTRWHAEFHALIIWCTLGHMLLAAAGELFTIFLALQLTSLPLIVLIGYAKRDARSGEAALKYLLIVLVSTAVLLYGMTLVYGSLGTSTLSRIGLALSKESSLPPALALGIVMLLTGFAFKITAVPFQFWAPDVYEGAPTPVSAFLSVGSKFAGFALALRVITTSMQVPLDWHLIFGVLAALSMFYGNLGAIRQTDIKRMLAYSGIAQAGYLLVGVAALSQQGIAGLLFYTVAYGLANLAAFSVVVAFAQGTGSTTIADYAGLYRRAPLTGLTLTIALLSLGGLPLMAGFMAKFYVFVSAAKAGLLWLVAVGVLNGVISLYYYLRVVWQIWVPEGEAAPLELSPRTATVMSVCVLGVIGLGLFPEPMLKAAVRAASALIGG